MSANKMQIYQRLDEGGIELRDINEDYFSIDSLIELLLKLKGLGATHIELNYDVCESSLDSCELKGVIERYETDAEYLQRLSYEEKKRQRSEQEAAKKIEYEKATLRYLQRKYPEV